MIRILTGEYCVWECPRDQAVELDLGCGKGSFLVALAKRYPQRWLVGADVMLGRLRRAARKCREAGVGNAELLRVEAWPLAAYHLPDACLERVHVLCPDPWPKRRHEANRLLSSEFLGRLATKLKPGGILHVATDDAEYLQFVFEAIRELSFYVEDAGGIDDIRDLKTDFERDFDARGIEVRHAAWRVNLQAAGGAARFPAAAT